MAEMERTDAELRDFFREHVLYELEMLFSLANHLAATKEEQARTHWDEIVQNAKLEAFALHARVLLAFLGSASPPNHQPNDAVAGQYVSGWSLAPADRDLIELIKKRVGAEVAHLSFGRMRLDQEAKKWPFAEMYYTIGRLTRSFIEQVPPDLVGSDAIEAALRFLPPKRSPEFNLSRAAGLLATQATGLSQELVEALRRAEAAE